MKISCMSNYSEIAAVNEFGGNTLCLVLFKTPRS